MERVNPAGAAETRKVEPIEVERLDHVAIVVTDVERARAFYVNVLGLREVPRPKSFDFPGAWFQIGPEVLHLLGSPRTEGTGRRHFCLWVKDVHAAARRVAAWDVSCFGNMRTRSRA